MPSGNTTYTYEGPDPEITIQGQTFPKGEPVTVTDNGIIAVLRAMDGDVAAEADPAPKAEVAPKGAKATAPEVAG
jgi:regulator of RNase E activity RraA